jgi:uncharacterized protein (DUF1330 family)
MAAYLINHLRIPNGIPKPEGLEYLERVEATFARYGGRWLVLDAQVDVVEGAWPGSVANLKSSSYRCPTLIVRHSYEAPDDHPCSSRRACRAVT